MAALVPEFLEVLDHLGSLLSTTGLEQVGSSRVETALHNSIEKSKGIRVRMDSWQGGVEEN